MVNVPTQTRTMHLPNINRKRHTNFVGNFLLFSNQTAVAYSNVTNKHSMGSRIFIEKPIFASLTAMNAVHVLTTFISS
jgi:hypothetical protein